MCWDPWYDGCYITVSIGGPTRTTLSRPAHPEGWSTLMIDLVLVRSAILTPCKLLAMSCKAASTTRRSCSRRYRKAYRSGCVGTWSVESVGSFHLPAAPTQYLY
jgi:hypothetical protein